MGGRSNVFRPGDISDDLRRLNPKLFGNPEQRLESKPPREEACQDAGGSCKTVCPKMNKSEAAVMQMLSAKFPGSLIFPQETRFFRLHGGGTYTPDFLVFRAGEPCLVVEVKGGYRGPGAEQGYDRYKRAALEFHGGIFRFQLWERRNGQWEILDWQD